MLVVNTPLHHAFIDETRRGWVVVRVINDTHRKITLNSSKDGNCKAKARGVSSAVMLGAYLDQPKTDGAKRHGESVPEHDRHPG